MEQATTPISLTGALPTPAAPSAAVELATLVREDCAALQARFAAARWDGPVALEGHPTGRMLAVPGFDRGLPASVCRLFGASFLNPWLGKSFASGEDAGGFGTNRVHVLGLRFAAFRFRTYATESVVDGAPALAIDYDVPDNPGFARATYDELRPVAEGLLLGRGMKRRRDGSTKLLVWFALDARRQDRPVPLRALSPGADPA